MNAFFATTALGLLAAWPASGLGWLLGKAADGLTGDPAPRSRAWSRAIALPPTVLALMAGVSALPRETTAPVYRALETSQAVAQVGAAMNEASVRVMSGFNGVETFGAVLILGALGGLATAGVRQIIGRAKLRRIVRDARPVSQDLSLAVRAAARRMDTGRPEVKISDQIDQPLLAGLLTPVILLPAELVERLAIDRLVPICAHELAHLKRGDNWRLLAEHLLGGLFWMVPPYARLRARAAAIREEACDALALDGAAPEVRRNYAEALIEVLRTRAAPTFSPTFTGKGRKPTETRLQAITTPRSPAGALRKATLGLASLLALAVAVAGGVALAQQADFNGDGSKTIVDADHGLNFIIYSDSIETYGKPTADQGHRRVYRGKVSIRGNLHAPGVVVLLNGKPAPAGFDPTALPKGGIEELWTTNYRKGHSPNLVLDVMTKGG